MTKEKLLSSVLNTMATFSGSVYENSDEKNTKSLAYICGYCDMAMEVLDWIEDKERAENE